MPIIKPIEVKDKDDIIIGECTHPAGHCYGSDGGSGIPEILKVSKGQGGDKEVWEIDKIKDELLSKAIYSFCQYCNKATYVQETEDSPKK